MSDLYTSESGIISNMTQLNIIANNITNANTTSYKSDTGTFHTFRDLMMERQTGNQKKLIGGISDEVFVDQVKTNFTQGTISNTGNPLDFALNDENNKGETSFFVVSKNGQQFLTRDGHFHLNANRQLVTQDGSYVLGQNGQPITIESEKNLSINKDGVITNQTGNQTVGKLGVVAVSSANQGFLSKQGNNLYSVMNIAQFNQKYGSINQILKEYPNSTTLQKTFPNIATLQAISTTGQIKALNNQVGTVVQGSLEQSNVNLGKQFADLIQTQQNVQVNEKAEQLQNQVLQQTVSGITKYA